VARVGPPPHIIFWEEGTRQVARVGPPPHMPAPAFHAPRDVYEEGMNAVVTVHDFSLIFDSLTQFEESLLSAKMETLGLEEEEEEEQVGPAGLPREAAEGGGSWQVPG